MEEQAILVDALDSEIGIAGKLDAHCLGSLHHAVMNPSMRDQ